MNFLFDDEVKDIANSYDCVLLPAGNRSRKVQWEVPRKSNGWAYGFRRANVWYASEEDSRLQDYLTRLVNRLMNMMAKIGLTSMLSNEVHILWETNQVNGLCMA